MRKFILLVLLLGLGCGCEETMPDCSVREISLRQGSEVESFCALSCRTFRARRVVGPRVDCKFRDTPVSIR